MKAVCLAAAALLTFASSTPAQDWQRNAVPYYDTVHALQGIYGHWALPRAQDFDRGARALVPAVAALCQAPAKDGNHRALGDIKDSIDELRYYRAAVMVPAPGPVSDVAAGIAAEIKSNPS